MRFRPASTTTTSVQPAPFQSSSPASPSPRKKESQFPLKLLSPNLQVHKSQTPRSSKRQKPNVVPMINVHYPTKVDIPSRKTVQVFYERAMTRMEGDDEPESHQSRLEGTGLLSFEQVLLPAVMQQHVEALKQVQAKVQRDAPQQSGVVRALQTTRRALYDAVDAGIQAAREARIEREAEQARLEALQAEQLSLAKEQARLEKQEAKQRQKEEMVLRKAAEKDRRKREMKKKLPKNVELWREVAMLMTQLAKLHKEERMWKETEQNLVAREKELSKREQELQQLQKQEDEPSSTQEQDNLQEPDLQLRADQAVIDITLAASRIEQTVHLVSELLVESDDVRKDLYSKYRNDHQFHGYKGVKNPKALIRAIVMD